MKMRLLSYRIIAAVCIFKETWAGLFLSPKPAFAVENGMVAFNFTSTENFSLVGINSFTTINFNNRCTASGSFTDTDRYQYNCVGNRTLIFTVSNLTRIDHTSFWTFFDLGSVNSLFAILYINVTVRDVTLSTNLTENDKKGATDVKENTSLEIICTSSDAFPNASVFLIGHDFKNDIYYTYPYTVVNIKDIGKYFYTLAVYILALNRTTRSLTFYCKANNTKDRRVESRNLSVEVLFPPDGPPCVMQSASEYTVIEKQKGHLTCSIDDSNPPTHLTWTCNGILQSNGSSKADNVANLTWTAQRNTVTRCTCSSSYESTTYGNVSLRIVTLFPASITKLKLNGTTSDVDIHEIKMIENSSVNIEWVTEGHPQPVFEWTEYSQNGSKIKPADITNASYSILNVDRSRNGNLCKFQAINNMKDSDGRMESNTAEKSLILIVLYPPKKEMVNVTLIEGNGIDISCGSGNVDHVFVKWSSQTNNGTTMDLRKVKRYDSGWFSCEVSYNMTSSFGDFEKGKIANTFYLDVLYPPEEIKVNSTTNRNLEVDDKIRIIHNDVVKLFCYASGKPIPVEHEWSGLNSSKSNVIVVKGNKDKSGNITCHAYNNLTEQPANTIVRGTGNRTFIVDVLYSPQVIDFSVLHFAEGTDVKQDCLYDPGKTTTIKVCWQKGNKTLSCNRTISVFNVTREDDGIYHCTVHFSMKPTFGEEVAMTVQTGLLLQVNKRSVNLQEVSEDSSTAVVVGGTLAGIVVIAVVVIVVAYFIRTRKQPLTSDEEPVAYQNVSSVQIQSSETVFEMNSANIYNGMDSIVCEDHEYQVLSSFADGKC